VIYALRPVHMKIVAPNLRVSIRAFCVHVAPGSLTHGRHPRAQAGAQ
jgi:hypothetical protein